LQWKFGKDTEIYRTCDGFCIFTRIFLISAVNQENLWLSTRLESLIHIKGIAPIKAAKPPYSFIEMADEQRKKQLKQVNCRLSTLRYPLLPRSLIKEAASIYDKNLHSFNLPNNPSDRTKTLQRAQRINSTKAFEKLHSVAERLLRENFSDELFGTIQTLNLEICLNLV